MAGGDTTGQRPEDSADDEPSQEYVDALRARHAEPPVDAELAIMRRAKQRHGAAGVIVAGGMLGIDKILGRPAKEEIPVVQEAAGEPLDIDNTGITVEVDDDRSVTSHPTGAATRRIVRRRRV